VVALKTNSLRKTVAMKNRSLVAIGDRIDWSSPCPKPPPPTQKKTLQVYIYIYPLPFMLRFGRKQQNFVKELSFNKINF